MSSNINIVLVKTSHPGNIGSTARAMKTMGLQNLKLISPKAFPSTIADANAVGCVDILKNADIYSTLSDCLGSSKIVIGFSARSRKCNIPSLTMNELIKMLINNKNKIISCPAFAKNTVDKVGAGDAMLSILSVTLKMKIDPEIAILIASIAAAVSVESIGNKESVSFDRIDRSLEYILK